MSWVLFELHKAKWLSLLTQRKWKFLAKLFFIRIVVISSTEYSLKSKDIFSKTSFIVLLQKTNNKGMPLLS